MPEQTSTGSTRVSGEAITSEVLRNLEDGIFKIRYTALVPSVFRIYLHQEEYEPLRGAIPFVIDEIKLALDERLAEWNNARRPVAFLKKLGGATQEKLEYKRLSPEWHVEFFPDTEGDLGPGEIEIHSELGAAPRAEYGVGSMTRRVVKLSSMPDGGVRREEVSAITDSGPVYAEIRYEDNGGPHVYSMAKDQIVIGRGGKAYWVDIRLDTLQDVSREHCRIRRDSASGEFYIKDVSQFGTSVDGRKLPSSIDRTGERETDKNIETRLAPKARIGLADVVYLDFEARSR